MWNPLKLVSQAALLGAFLAAPPAHAQTSASARGGPSDSAAVVAVVTSFHEALASGDTVRVMRLLAEDVSVLEGGGLETRDEYLSHHLPGDIAFAAAVERERGSIHVTLSGDVAWAVSTSRTRGTMRGREIDSQGAELMVLARYPDGWKIRAIHWSSRRAG